MLSLSVQCTAQIAANVEASERNDWEAATAMWAHDVVHHVPGRSPLAGDFSGKQAFLDHYGRVLDELGGTIEVVMFHHVLASVDHAVARHNFVCRRLKEVAQYLPRAFLLMTSLSIGNLSRLLPKVTQLELMVSRLLG